MRRIWLLVIVTVLVASAACSSDDDAAPETTEAAALVSTEPSAPTTEPSGIEFVAPEWEPETRVEELAFAMSTSPEGATLQHAIDSFGLLVPDFPGVTASELPPGEVVSGSSILALITSMSDRLSDEQREMVDDYLNDGTMVARISPDGTIENPDRSPTVRSGSAGWRRTGDPSIAGTYATLLAEMRQAWVEHLENLGHVAPGHIYELWLTDESTGAMDAALRRSSPDVCNVRVSPEFISSNPSTDTIRWGLAHELFHCMQYRWAQEAGTWPPVTPHTWAREGSAEWAVADLFRNRSMTYSSLRNHWFVDAHKPLGGRAYDAWPLFENAWRNGRDVYGSIISLFQSPVAEVAPMLAVGGLDGLIFRIDWGTRAVRDSAFGDDWWLDWAWLGHELSGPTKNSVGAGPIGLGTGTFIGLGGFSQESWTVQISGDVDVVTVLPTGSPLTTFTAAGTKVVADGTWGRFCFDPTGCVCPGADGDAWPMLDRSMLVSFAPSEKRPRAQVYTAEWNPDEQCQEDQPDQGSSNGDPHLVSFDGLPFDVVMLGEFVLARDPAGDFEVQTRHVPVGVGTGTTAVAIGDGAHRVTFTMPESSADGPPTVRVDGATMTEREFLAGELRVTVNDEASVMTWPDGSTLALDWFLGWFVTVTVPAERAARMEGLLGSADGDLRNDLRMPDGSTVDTNDAAAHDSPYALAWAVDESTTLFDYEPGESVATFRIPHPFLEPPQVDEPAIDACSSALGSDATGHDVASCAYDVSATGDEGFVDAYVAVVDERAAGPTLGEPLLVRPTTEPPQTAAPAVEGAAGQPALVLSAEQPAGTVEAVAGTVLLAVAEPCAGLNVSIEVTAVGESGWGRASLCGRHSVGLDDDDESFDGEAYVWLPSSGPHNVELATTVGDAEALGDVAVYIDPSPTVIDASTLADGDQSTLTALGDTVVYLPDPAETYDATGLGTACAVEVWSGNEFPDPEPRQLAACEHTNAIDFPPTDMLIPVVVFNRTGDEITVGLAPDDRQR